MNVLLQASLLAATCEALTEYLLAPTFDLAAIPSKYLLYASTVIGMALALVFRFDLITPLTGLATPSPYVGQILTGFLISRGSNYIHDFASRWVRKPS